MLIGKLDPSTPVNSVVATDLPSILSPNSLIADTLRRVLVQEEAIRLRNVTEALVAKAESGDVSAIKEVFDRIDGKSVATQELTGPDGSNLPSGIGILFVKPDDSNIS